MPNDVCARHARLALTTSVLLPPPLACQVSGERQPGWLAATRAVDDEEGRAETPSGAESAERGSEGAAVRDADEQEAARKEWLQYHLQLGEWDKAAELVVTAEEEEDLQYLREKEGAGQRL
jgi:hypothetical protein